MKEWRELNYQKNILKSYFKLNYNSISPKKIEIENNDDPRILNAVAFLCLALEDEVKKSATLKSFEKYIEFKEVMNELKFEHLLPIDECKFKLFWSKTKNTEFLKLTNNFYSQFKKIETINKSKEIICKQLAEVKMKNNFSYNEISKVIFHSKIDSSNIHKFISKNDYTRISMDILKEARKEIKKWT